MFLSIKRTSILTSTLFCLFFYGCILGKGDWNAPGYAVDIRAKDEIFITADVFDEIIKEASGLGFEVQKKVPYSDGTTLIYYVKELNGEEFEGLNYNFILLAFRIGLLEKSNSYHLNEMLLNRVLIYNDWAGGNDLIKNEIEILSKSILKVLGEHVNLNSFIIVRENTIPPF